MENPSNMEVDGAGPQGGSESTDDMQLNPLKRSNSAPMINALGVDTDPPTSLPPPTEAEILATSSCFKPMERVRRFSTSSMALNSTAASSCMKGPSRLIQIRNEESVMQKDREVAHEREIQSAMQLSHSMEEIFVDETMTPVQHQQQASPQPPAPSLHLSAPATHTASGLPDPRRPKSLGEPLHIHVSSQYYPYASSPSPTRLGKQCFSPSLQQPVYRSGGLTPSPSPSPTRKTFASPLSRDSRRSLSPITLRPSPLGNLGTKRKMDLDGERMDTFCSPAKRFHASSPGGSTPERGHALYHQLLHNISSSSFEAANSPDQRVPGNHGNLSAASANMSSTSSPASFFRPVRESTESRCTDSEASDMAETTDNSDQSMSHNLSSSLSQMSDAGVGPISDSPAPGTGLLTGSANAMSSLHLPSTSHLTSGTAGTSHLAASAPHIHTSPCIPSSSSLSPSVSSTLSSIESSSSGPPSSISSLSPQPSSASGESSSSSSLLAQPMATMSVGGQAQNHESSLPTSPTQSAQSHAMAAARQTPDNTASQGDATNSSVQFYSQSTKVTQV